MTSVLPLIALSDALYECQLALGHRRTKHPWEVYVQESGVSSGSLLSTFSKEVGFNVLQIDIRPQEWRGLLGLIYSPYSIDLLAGSYIIRQNIENSTNKWGC